MEQQDYQQIFDATKNLQGKKLEEALLAFANGNKQMEEEMKAMFARIDAYHEVIQSSKQYRTEEEWVEAELKDIANIINAKSKDKVTPEDVRRALFGGEKAKEPKSNA